MSQDQAHSTPIPAGFQNPYIQLLDIRDDGLGPGWARTLLEQRPELSNMHGAVHGGVLMSLLDTTMARAAVARQAFQLSVVSIGVTANFIKPGKGCLRTEARAIGGGRSTCFCEAEIRDEAGDLVAKGTGTFKYQKPPKTASDVPSVESIE